MGTPLNTPLHPTQIYESIACLVIFFILVAIASRKKFHGQVALAYVILYAVARFVIEFFRENTPAAGHLSAAQWACLVGFAFFAVQLARLLRRREALSFGNGQALPQLH